MTVWADLAEALPKFIGGGFLTWACSVVWKAWEGRHAKADRNAKAEVDQRQHTDKILADIASIARADEEALRAEVTRARAAESASWDQLVEMQPLRMHLQRLREAIERIIDMACASDPQERLKADRRGLEFVNRSTTADPSLLPPLSDGIKALLDQLGSKL